VLIRPLTHVSMQAAAVIWQFAKYASLLAIFAMSWRLVSPDRPVSLMVKAGSIVMSLRFITSDLAPGNVNIFITLAVVLGLWCLCRHRPGLSGFFVAVAACVKVTPGLFGAYLLYKRQWRALVGVAVGVAIMLEAVPLAVLTPAQNHALLRSWFEH